MSKSIFSDYNLSIFAAQGNFDYFKRTQVLYSNMTKYIFLIHISAKKKDEISDGTFEIAVFVIR